MARILIVGGGCRGRALAAEMVAAGHVVRITTRTEDRRAQIESVGAECWVGTPDRLATLRGVLDGVAIACWMLAGVRGPVDQVAALHGSRLKFFLRQVIDINPNFIFAKDRIGRFTMANKAVAEAYGTTVDKLVGNAWSRLCVEGAR